MEKKWMSWRGCWDYRRKDGRFENSGLCGKIMAKLVEITGKAMSGEWGFDDETGNGIPVLRTTNFTNEGQLVELFILMAQKKHTCLIISQVYYG